MKKQSGTALLIVMAATALMSVFVLHVWFVMGFACDVVLQQQEWYCNFYTTDMMLNVGLIDVQKHFSKFICLSKPTILNLSPLLNNHKQNNQEEKVLLIVRPCSTEKPDALLVTAHYYKHQACVCQIRCLLQRVVTYHNHVRKQYFVVSHFTFGTHI